jgi:hypothetical protein
MQGLLRPLQGSSGLRPVWGCHHRRGDHPRGGERLCQDDPSELYLVTSRLFFGYVSLPFLPKAFSSLFLRNLISGVALSLSCELGPEERRSAVTESWMLQKHLVHGICVAYFWDPAVVRCQAACLERLAESDRSTLGVVMCLIWPDIHLSKFAPRDPQHGCSSLLAMLNAVSFLVLLSRADDFSYRLPAYAG